MRVLEQLGIPLAADSPARWRALLAAMREELGDAQRPVDAVFLFERLMQLVL